MEIGKEARSIITKKLELFDKKQTQIIIADPPKKEKL